LESLKNRARDSDGAVAGATVSEFVVRKKNEVAAITEVSVPVCCYHRILNSLLLQHALFCAAWERDRNADRSKILSDVRAKRFDE
jgi:hypothetical protein